MEIQVNDILHQRVIDTCIPLYKDEHYQHAALESMKQVEMALRDKGIASKDLFGVNLVKWVMGNGAHITLSVPFGKIYKRKRSRLQGRVRIRPGTTPPTTGQISIRKFVSA